MTVKRKHKESDADYAARKRRISEQGGENARSGKRVVGHDIFLEVQTQKKYRLVFILLHEWSQSDYNDVPAVRRNSVAMPPLFSWLIMSSVLPSNLESVPTL